MIEQTRQNQLIKEFYTKHEENFRQEQIEYFIHLLNLFKTLPNSPEISSSNADHISFEDLKIQFNQQINFLLDIYKNSQDKTILSIISEFEEKFAHLFNNDDEISEIKNSDNPILNNLISFLNELYEHVNKILNEKRNVNQKLISLEKRNQRFFKWEFKKSKSYEDKQSNLNAKSLPDETQELINSHSNNNYDSSSPQSTIGKHSV